MGRTLAALVSLSVCGCEAEATSLEDQLAETHELCPEVLNELAWEPLLSSGFLKQSDLSCGPEDDCVLHPWVMCCHCASGGAEVALNTKALDELPIPTTNFELPERWKALGLCTDGGDWGAGGCVAASGCSEEYDPKPRALCVMSRCRTCWPNSERGAP